MKGIYRIMNELNFNASYVDRRTWILANLENLNCNAEEVLILLLIDYCNQEHLPISHETLMEKSNLSMEAIESIFTSLSDKGYLTTQLIHGSLTFDIAGLYQAHLAQGVPLQKSLIEQFQDSFGRTLSQKEMQRILELSSIYEERMIVCALNEAVVYDSMNINYIERILQTWKDKGLSVEDVENGKR